MLISNYDNHYVYKRPLFSFLRLIGYFCCLLLGLSSQPIYAACDLFRNVKNAPGLALVIGNNRYQNGTLKHSVNDATDMLKTLTEMGFKASLKPISITRQMNSYTRRFGDCLKDNQGVGLFYFSGHGTQTVEQLIENNQIVYEDKTNYLLPINNNANILDEENVKRKAFPVKTLLNRLKRPEIKLILLFWMRIGVNLIRGTRWISQIFTLRTELDNCLSDS